MNLTCTVETITPEIAAAYLALNKKNRALKPTAIARYADDMRNGKWLLNGEALRFDEEGFLIDGQNRLTAVIAAGVAIQSLVVRGLRDEAQETIDTGIRRSPGDTLGMKGFKEPNSSASAARLLSVYRKNNGFILGGAFLTNAETVRVMHENPRLSYAMATVSTAPLGTGIGQLLPRSDAGFLYFIFDEIDSNLAHEFFEKLATGADLESGSSILLLRNRLLADRAAKARLGRTEKLALCIKAWNKFRENTNTKTLRWSTRGDRAPEAFPTAA